MKFILDILKGAVMGLANVIPGVSGGTMAVSMGIYDKLINSITHLFKDFKRCFMTLLPIIIGMAVGIVGLSVVIEWMFGVVPIQTNLLFIGLIVGGVPMIYARVKSTKVKIWHILGFVIFFGLVVGLAFIQHDTEIEKSKIEAQREEEKKIEKEADNFQLSEEVQAFEINGAHLALMFGAGVIASATMVIPGVSGSMMMMLMGIYTLIIGLVSGFIKSALAGNWDAVINCVKLLIPFGIGVIVGILGIAKIIELLISKAEALTFWCILGLIAGSPFAIVIVNIEKFHKINFVSGLTGLVALVIGCVVAFFLGGSEEGKKEVKEAA